MRHVNAVDRALSSFAVSRARIYPHRATCDLGRHHLYAVGGGEIASTSTYLTGYLFKISARTMGRRATRLLVAGLVTTTS